MNLTSEHVTELFMDCLFAEGEPTDDHVKVEGIITTVGFHPERLESHRQDVKDMLLDLPSQFLESGGGGWSFLNACQDKNDDQWTSLHQVMEQLFLLGIGLGLCDFQLSRDLWSALPGGMPYVIVKDKSWES